MRKPSAESELRSLRRQHKELQLMLSSARQDRESFRSRATKAEQDAAEWKQRFDALLARTPVLRDGEGA